jgi:hypothetical protein
MTASLTVHVTNLTPSGVATLHPGPNYDELDESVAAGLAQNGLHAERFTHRTVYTQNGLHAERFTRRTVYTQNGLHAERLPLFTTLFCS